MGWRIRVTAVQEIRRQAAQAASQAAILAQWQAGPQGLQWLHDLCYQGHALRISERDAGTARYVLSVAVLRNAIHGNAVFADESELRESMTGILRALRDFAPPELVFIEAQPRT